jgi:hypothetical protein
MRWKIIFVEKEMIQQTWMGTPADELTRQAILAVVLAAALGLGRFPFFVSSVDSFVHVPVDIFSFGRLSTKHSKNWRGRIRL